MCDKTGDPVMGMSSHPDWKCFLPPKPVPQSHDPAYKSSHVQRLPATHARDQLYNQSRDLCLKRRSHDLEKDYRPRVAAYIHR